ncbi:MAG: DEAD/DEAH box helicase family protein [Lachnospiraceae bacterium]|nr:DEAD/DEAH box helicase family protein [Lachnospiraceae bacterium]
MGSMKIVLSNLIYVDTKNLKYRLQNQVRRLAAFLNPVYFKNQRIGYSNYLESRTIYMGQEEYGYIGIPRGQYDELVKRCEEAGIHYHLEDKRTVGRRIDVTFQGELRKSQIPAVKKMLEKDTGILSAATAFGKTVVCGKLIAERKVSTLILLESSALMEQWADALQDFLDIKEELPEYQTPSGRIKKRKSVIGKIHGAHDSSTGIIDIAMVGSLYKKGEFHPRLQEYGMVIMDECHHAASATVEKILREVKAKYVYGVTATPMRSDGLEKINYMLLGDIRYRYTAKDRAKEQGMEYLVCPRFTRVAYPRRQEMHINDAYMLIRDNEVRNMQIVDDVKKCIANGRTPVILTRYKEHASLLNEKLQACADKIFFLSGDKSKKELQEIRRRMEEVSADETMILVATGQMVGEGFDYPRLDTLIMATPVSWKGIVEQYAGRLNREYVGKKDVVIYDYVDSHIDKFDKMYGKRLKAYKQIGYQICANISGKKQEAGAIYDFENYHEVFERDLQEAKKDIIIASPQMNRKKVYRMISLLKECQEAGVKVTIVTWHPDCYKYGKSEVRMELLEQLRGTGFEIQLMEEACEHFAVVDQKIVWYGNMNFLSKEDMEDNLMRVISGEIAAEIMEMTFGTEAALVSSL